MIPENVTGRDSVEMFNSIVDDWVKEKVLAALADEQLYDTEEIDRKVREYRNQLIVLEYLTKMRASREPKISEEKVREYYDKHKDEITLENPLMKGVILAVNSDRPGKDKIKPLLTSEDPKKFDELEKEWADKASQYEYFRDRWLDWESVSDMLPLRIENPDKYFTDAGFYEFENDDKTYYVRITDYLPSGSEQPFEYAKTWIQDLLTEKSLSEYERELVESRVKEALKEKKIEAIGYDPVKHEIIEK